MNPTKTPIVFDAQQDMGWLASGCDEDRTELRKLLRTCDVLVNFTTCER